MLRGSTGRRAWITQYERVLRHEIVETGFQIVDGDGGAFLSPKFAYWIPAPKTRRRGLLCAVYKRLRSGFRVFQSAALAALRASVRSDEDSGRRRESALARSLARKSRLAGLKIDVRFRDCFKHFGTP